VCIAEDRTACEPALRLLIESLDRNCSGLPIHIFYPPANESFMQWAKAYSQVVVRTEPLHGAYHWNVKPHAILHLLAEGCEEVVWIDSDVIAARSLTKLFQGLASDTIAVAEEALWGAHSDVGALRARLWGFQVGRVLPFAINSAVVRVTRHHAPLLNRWKELLESPEYKQNQLLDWRDKPAHMMGDQDVLSALLTSREFAEIPVKVLRRGNDIIQYLGLSGYTVAERIKNILFCSPSFIHAQGQKPWMIDHGAGSTGKGKYTLREYIEAVYLDLSPYTLSAMSLSGALDGRAEWTRPHFALSAALRLAGFWYPPLVGLPIAAFVDCASFVKGRAGRKRGGYADHFRPRSN